MNEDASSFQIKLTIFRKTPSRVVAASTTTSPPSALALARLARRASNKRTCRSRIKGRRLPQFSSRIAPTKI